MADKQKKAYKTGLIVGRFQVLHKGHGDVIRKALELCEELVILVGSSQEAGTLKNPLDYETRKSIILQAFPDTSVYPLPDIGVGNVGKWGDYVMEKAREYCGHYPDLAVSGRESRRTSWIEEKWNIAELYIPKSIDISATIMIQYILRDEYEVWKEYIEPSIISRYTEIRECVIKSENKLETSSI